MVDSSKALQDFHHNLGCAISDPQPVEIYMPPDSVAVKKPARKQINIIRRAKRKTHPDRVVIFTNGGPVVREWPIIEYGDVEQSWYWLDQMILSGWYPVRDSEQEIHLIWNPVAQMWGHA